MHGTPPNDYSASEAHSETLELRLLETSARYLYVNSFPLPLVVIALTLILWHWHPFDALAIWSVTTLSTWAILGFLIHLFLHDETRYEKRHAWAFWLSFWLFVATVSLASVAPLFWVENDRLNNVLLYVFVAAGMANAAGQSAPSKTMAYANLVPYGVIFISLFLLHEPFPFNFAFAAVGGVYCGLVVMYAMAVRQLASEMLLLREEKRDLIERLEAALSDAMAARKRAETASQAKSQFLANMSHELRTPLNAVLGFSEVIRDRMFGNDAMDRYSDYADSIHMSGSHLLGLINDILDLSKIEAGKLELQVERFDLTVGAADALRFVEPQAKRKNVCLARELPSQCEVVADKRALRQIAVNLLANAVKFTPPGGTVTLALSREATGAVILTVRDTGIGIRPEDRERVLESFGQGRHDILPTEDHGTGLGLAIAKSLVEAHGGRITLESQVGEGTTVTVTLPQADSHIRAA